MTSSFGFCDACKDEAAALTLENLQLRAALTNLFGLVSDGTLVRDISKDHESGWATRLMHVARILATAQILSAQ